MKSLARRIDRISRLVPARPVPEPEWISLLKYLEPNEFRKLRDCVAASGVVDPAIEPSDPQAADILSLARTRREAALSSRKN
jgi:hypothetical protein